MKPYTEKIEAKTNVEKTQFNMRLGKEQLSKISRLLITNQYQTPLSAAIREVLSNAYDANTVAGYEDNKQRPVDIFIDKETISIRDYGSGLSEEEMFNLYTLIGFSTKEDDEQQIGAFGIGRLAPLALNNSFFITSYHNNSKKLYCCFLDSDHIPSLSKWDEESSTEPSGLEVKILVPEKFYDQVSAKNGKYNDLIRKVLYLTQGGRFKVRISLSREVSSNTTWKQKDFEDYHYFTVANPKEGLEVSVYLLRKTLNNYGSQFYIDLGGALYHADNVEPKKALWSDQTQFPEDENGKCTTLEEWCKSPYSKQNKTLHQSSNDRNGAYNHTIVIRVPPDYIPLSTSREKLVLEGEYQEKASALISRAKELIKAEYEQRLAKELPSMINVNGLDVFESTRKVLRSCAAYGPCTAPLAETLHLTLSYPLPNGRRLEIINQLDEYKYAPAVDTSFDVYNEETKTYTIDLRRFGLSFCSLIYKPKDKGLSDEERQAQMRASSFIHTFFSKSGKYKRRMFADVAIQLGDLFSTPMSVVYSPSKYINIGQINNTFGKETTEKPVIIISTKHQLKTVLQFGDLVNYLGECEVEATAPTKAAATKTSSTTDIGFSVLMRQLRHTTQIVDTSAKRIILEKEDINEEILQERIIYFSKDGIGNHNSLNQIPKLLYQHPTHGHYIQDYSPLFALVTDNVIDKLAVHKNNWVSAYNAALDIGKQFIDDYGLMIEFVASPRHLAMLRAIAGHLSDFIPQATLDLLNWKGNVIDVCKCISYSYPNYKSELKDKTGHLRFYTDSPEFYTERLKNDDRVYSLYGPALAPYVNALYMLEYNLTSSLQQPKYPEMFKAVRCAVLNDLEH